MSQEEELIRLRKLVDELNKAMRIGDDGSLFTHMTDLENASMKVGELLEAERQTQIMDARINETKEEIFVNGISLKITREILGKERMSFGIALELMKAGYKMARKAWLEHDDIGGCWVGVRVEEDGQPRLVKGYSQNLAIQLKGWTASPGDLFTDDWYTTEGGVWPGMGLADASKQP